MSTPTLTFGVEIEALVPYVRDGKVKDPDEKTETRPLIRVDQSCELSEWRDGIHQYVRDLLAEHGVPVQGPNDLPGSGANGAGGHGKFVRSLTHKYCAWNVKLDMSVDEPRRDLGYNWSNLEVASMAMWATDASYDYVRHVISILNNNVRLRLNGTCGLHVHVGNGEQTFDDATIYKLAALLWAADGVLSQLHPPERSLF